MHDKILVHSDDSVHWAPYGLRQVLAFLLNNVSIILFFDKKAKLTYLAV